jgi:hypothetical protein
MKIIILFSIFTKIFLFNVAYAEEKMQLRGKNFACQNSQKMGLWDISGNSPLIRDEMMESNFCWRTFQGQPVYLVGYVDKFAKVTNLLGKSYYLIYKNDLEKFNPPKPNPPRDSNSYEISKLSLVSIKNTVENEVYEINNFPTVQINIRANSKLSFYFTITKNQIKEGFDQIIHDQKNNFMQFGGKCETVILGVGIPDFYSFKIVKIDTEKKIANIEISGSLEKCSINTNRGYKILNANLEIKGKNFDELMRPHTAKELSKKFQPFKW